MFKNTHSRNKIWLCSY